jgi:hypothetical protein
MIAGEMPTKRIQHDRVRRVLVAVAMGAVAVVGFGSTISYAASPGAATRGDARGVFQAFFTGGFAIRAHNHLAEGVPGVPVETTPDGARIYPGGDGFEYCEQGWHVVMLGYFEDPAFFGGNRELFEFLATVDFQFVLDGVPLEVERTAIKRFSHPLEGLSEEAFAVGFGAFLPPGALSAGTHRLRTFIHDPVFGDLDFTVGITVVSC